MKYLGELGEDTYVYEYEPEIYIIVDCESRIADVRSSWLGYALRYGIVDMSGRNEPKDEDKIMEIIKNSGTFDRIRDLKEQMSDPDYVGIPDSVKKDMKEIIADAKAGRP